METVNPENIRRTIAEARRTQLAPSELKAMLGRLGISLRTFRKIESGDTSVSLGRYLAVAQELNLAWLFSLCRKPGIGVVPPAMYLTGITALCIPDHDGFTPLWYSSALGNTRAWQVAGFNLASSSTLLGAQGLYDATSLTKAHGIEANTLWAATYERAVFDLLYHYCHLNERAVPNVQASDIDDLVDLDRVLCWIQDLSAFLDQTSVLRMHQWLGVSVHGSGSEKRIAHPDNAVDLSSHSTGR